MKKITAIMILKDKWPELLGGVIGGILRAISKGFFFTIGALVALSLLGSHFNTRFMR